MPEGMQPSLQQRLRERLAGWAAKLRRPSFPKAQFQNIELSAVIGWISKSLQRQGASFYGGLLTVTLCAFFLADLTSLWVGRLIPEPPSPHLVRSFDSSKKSRMIDDYQIIFSRNLFHHQGLIPGDDEPTSGRDLGGLPVKTSLPFNLIGTVILEDENRSIATIEDKSASQVFPVRVQDEIPGKAKILKVEARKVIFVNMASGRREFVDLPDDLQVSNHRLTLGSSLGAHGTTSTGPGIEKVAPNQFSISRTEVDKAIADLNNILTQARAVPNMENGQPAGYKLFQIVPGSIYDKLGLQNGDVIAGLNGSPVNDPGKAFEMISELKTSSHLELQIKRDGRVSNFIYDIH